MKKISVLVVDDDPKIRKLLSVNLEKRNYAVQEAADGDQAITWMEQDVPDLVILDLVMPGINGNDICLWIRDRGLDIPIIVLSAHDEEDLKVRALDAGADDYIMKPFKTEEFLARMRAIMRRAGTSDVSPGEAKINIEGLSIDLNGRRAFVDETDMHLTRTEFALLAALGKHCDAVITHDELLANVWGDEYRGSSHYLHVYLGRIRRKMGDKYSSLLETVPGQGYLLNSKLQG
jgi:two-component system, OmpR family, KDP operon response regulator KdpE